MPELILERRSPLGTVPGAGAATVAADRGLYVVEEPWLTVLSLRRPARHPEARDDGSASVRRSLAALGMTPPARPNEFLGDATVSCAWVEPHAWFILRT